MLKLGQGSWILTALCVVTLNALGEDVSSFVSQQQSNASQQQSNAAAQAKSEQDQGKDTATKDATSGNYSSSDVPSSNSYDSSSGATGGGNASTPQSGPPDVATGIQLTVDQQQAALQAALKQDVATGIGRSPFGINNTPAKIPPCTPGAERTNQPVNYNMTKEIGSKLQAGETNSKSWATQLNGQATNYNSYSTPKDDKSLVIQNMNTCAAGYVCDFSQANQGTPMKATSLFGQRGFASPSQRAAALAFIQNITNPTPTSYPTDAKVYKNPKKKSDGLTDDGISYFATLFKQLPMLSLTQYVFDTIYAERDPLPGLATGLPVGKNGAASIMEMYEFEAARRYMNPCWFDYMVGGTEQAVRREIAFMMAFQNFMAVQAYEQNQRIEALMAAQLAVSTGLMNQMSNQTSSSNMKATTKQISSSTSTGG